MSRVFVVVQDSLDEWTVSRNIQKMKKLNLSVRVVLGSYVKVLRVLRRDGLPDVIVLYGGEELTCRKTLLNLRKVYPQVPLIYLWDMWPLDLELEGVWEVHQSFWPQSSSLDGFLTVLEEALIWTE